MLHSICISLFVYFVICLIVEATKYEMNAASRQGTPFGKTAQIVLLRYIRRQKTKHAKTTFAGKIFVEFHSL
jgi:hypothetical protein